MMQCVLQQAKGPHALDQEPTKWSDNWPMVPQDPALEEIGVIRDSEKQLSPRANQHEHGRQPPLQTAVTRVD